MAKTRLKVGIGKYVVLDYTMPKLGLTRKNEFIKSVKCHCGGRYKIDVVVKCTLCFYQGSYALMAFCVKCDKKREMWLLPDGRLAI